MQNRTSTFVGQSENSQRDGACFSGGSGTSATNGLLMSLCGVWVAIGGRPRTLVLRDQFRVQPGENTQITVT